MDKKQIIQILNDDTDKDRPIRIKIDTPDGTIDRAIWSIELADEALYLYATDLVPEPEPEELVVMRRTVKPLPSSPYIGPNGEFYPMGGGTTKEEQAVACTKAGTQD